MIPCVFSIINRVRMNQEASRWVIVPILLVRVGLKERGLKVEFSLIKKMAIRVGLRSEMVMRNFQVSPRVYGH
jgi:hypothetical protein